MKIHNGLIIPSFPTFMKRKCRKSVLCDGVAAKCIKIPEKQVDKREEPYYTESVNYKGKPVERRGRKAKGLRSEGL